MHTYKGMVQTKAGAARNPWLKAQRECAAAYRDGTPIKAAKKECNCDKTTAAKSKEVDKAVAKEKVAVHARAKQAARALKADADKIRQPRRQPERHARRSLPSTSANQGNKWIIRQHQLP